LVRFTHHLDGGPALIRVAAASPSPRDAREAVAVRYLVEEGGHAFVEATCDVTSVLSTIRPERWINADYSGDL
jgi:hypothetical protein